MAHLICKARSCSASSAAFRRLSSFSGSFGRGFAAIFFAQALYALCLLASPCKLTTLFAADTIRTAVSRMGGRFPRPSPVRLVPLGITLYIDTHNKQNLFLKLEC